MGLIKYRPFEGFGSLGRAMQSFLEDYDNIAANDNYDGSFIPKVDISEDEKNYFFHVEAPGVKKEDLKISVNEDNVLVIRGEKKNEVKEEDRNFYRIERTFGDFARSFTLPDDVNSEDVEAKFENGIINIRIGRKEPVKPKQIDVEIK